MKKSTTCLWATDDETTRWVQVVDSVGIEVLGWDDSLNAAREPKNKSQGDLSCYATIKEIASTRMASNTHLANLRLEFSTELIVGDLWGVLGADHNGVHTLGDASSVVQLVLDSNL